MLNLPWCRLIFLDPDNLGFFLFFANLLIHGFECRYKLGYFEKFTLVGVVDDDSCVCALGGCANSFILGGGAGVLVVFGGRRFYSDSVVTLGEKVRFAEQG